MLKDQRIIRVIQASVMLLCLLGLGGTARAQKKKPVRKAPVKSTATSAASSSFILRDERDKVATQITNLTHFIYVLGGVAKTIDDIDKDPKATPATRAKNNSAKQTVVQTVKNMRAAIVQLEGEFHEKAELRPYIQYIQGASEMAGVAEDQASSGQLNNSGKTLIEVVTKLTDTLKNL
jgi:hypothetical protein